jgi:SAM-dependent methyltransferase
MHLPTVYINFPSRENRSRFVATRFKEYLEKSVLDVGCFEAPLRNLLPNISYTGIDIAGQPDLTINLEEVDSLPFDDKTFQSVLCIDVLEHLDNFHAIFAELIRISNKFIIVSLPNCWCDARLPVERGKGKFSHYGLPLYKPKDRHKWFFNLTDARQFIEFKAKEFHLNIEDMLIAEKPRNKILRFLRKIHYPGDRYHNRFSRTLWVVLKKLP